MQTSLQYWGSLHFENCFLVLGRIEEPSKKIAARHACRPAISKRLPGKGMASPDAAARAECWAAALGHYG